MPKPLPRFAAFWRLLLVALGAALALAALPVEAFPIPAQPVAVVEYYNAFLGHYFLTAHAQEMDDIDAGKAGPGWVRTGYSFDAYLPDAKFCPGFCGLPVSRFYGTPGLGPNSHFYTADPAEAASLEHPGTGWSLEGAEFIIGVPDASGQCGPGLTPVYRLYNNGWMRNDSNHRYVTSAEERSKMVARGWTDEGARFCTYGAAEIPIRSYEVLATADRIEPSSVCEDESVSLGSCIALNNLAAPRILLPPLEPQSMPQDFFERTGVSSSFDYVERPESPAAQAADVFVQPGYHVMGIHVSTVSRGPSLYSSVNPLYQFRSGIDPGKPDARFFPFTDQYESDTELAIHFTLNVKRLNVANASSAAYGHPTLEFVDQRSGHHLYFTVIAYGTVSASADYLAPDVATGKTIVGTSFRAGTPYGRSLGLDTLPTPSGFVSPNSWGWGGYFEFRMNRDEFQRVLDSARTVDGALSGDVRDYLLDNFHFNNEVVGDGEIGLNLDAFELQIVRR